VIKRNWRGLRRPPGRTRCRWHARARPPRATACQSRATTPRYTTVGATPSPSRGRRRRESTPKTLGALLYADEAKPRASEKDWVVLIQSIAAGDQRGLHALYERTHRLVFTLIMRITNDRQAAEELTLDTFHDVWRRAATYDAAGGSVIGWIMNQARSRAIDRIRFEQRKKRVNPHANNPVAETSGTDSEESIELTQNSHHLRNALTILTPQEREAIETAFFSELTYPEVAARLKQPVGTVKTRIRSALGKLRQELAKRPL
jgi:RNA polymerase sigma-70 factor, ECF subfamily